MLAVKRKKNARKSVYFCKKNKSDPQKRFIFFIYLLGMPKYRGKQIFTHRSFPEVGQNQKTEKREKDRERKIESG